MNQATLDRAVARATGESVTQIRKHGFSLLVVPQMHRLETQASRVKHHGRRCNHGKRVA